MRVLSLFDGISCGQFALNRIGIKPEIYFASEIDKHAIKVTQHNFPNTIQIGDIQKIGEFVKAIGPIDLLLAGSPCQGFSQAGKMLGFNDPRSQLFFNAVSILGAVKPKNFLFENVRLKKSDAEIFKLLLGVEHVEINSALVSAQNRRRYYWTNIEFDEIKDLGRTMQTDIDSRIIGVEKRPHGYNTGGIGYRNGKAPTVTKSAWYANFFPIYYNGSKGFFTPENAEILQTLPVGYTSNLTKHRRFEVIGNCWTVDVIAHILKGLE